ncbi:hypothetical protein MAR_008773 [Mya arenaria]|uniref:Sushi domain-containing protein n=1 Tax=Mya arenaria TaxID=6604 RepID=A0ABY7DZU9_MYAAR|nr:hypothetical protein MAR_008773 [Mya arenaria]
MFSVQCVTPPTLTSGQYTLTSDNTQTSASVECDIGSTLSGSVTLSCDVTGQWEITGDSPSCVLESSSQASSGGDDLLTAVIALSILSALLAVGLVTLAVYAFVIKGIAGSCKVDNVRAPAKASAFPISRAPVDHSQHVMDSRILPTPLHPEYTMTPSEVDMVIYRPDKGTSPCRPKL